MVTLERSPQQTRPRRGLPVLGPSLAYLRDPLAMMREHYDRYGPVCDVDMSGRRTTLLLGPDACGVALRNPDKAFANGPGWGQLVGPFFDRGLMLLDFDEHHRHRRLMQQAFTRDRIAAYAAALGPAVEQGLAGWRPDPAFRAYPALKDLTLDLAMRIFMGGSDLAGPPERAEVNRAFVACVQAAGGWIHAPLPGTRWRRAHRGRRVLEEFLGRHIPAKRAGDGADLFSALCHVTDETGASFSDADVVNHMIFLLMAAHDTSTITVTTLMRYLGQHPQWRRRCRDEAAGLSAAPSPDELDALVSFDLVMKEALRLVPPVPVLARRTVAGTEVLGEPIPAGRMTAVMLHLSHHMPELWSEPERFDPERFGEDRREDKSHKHAWEPFGGGVHKCLGMAFAGVEVKLLLHHLLRRFDWSVAPGYRPPMNHHSLPFPRDGQPVDLRPLRASPG